MPKRSIPDADDITRSGYSPMTVDRRSFFVGLLAAPAVVCAANIMPVRSILRLDPAVYGIRWQSWPEGMPRPYYHSLGQYSRINNDKAPLSQFLPRLADLRRLTPELSWEVIWWRAGTTCTPTSFRD